jgi:hypothetical protein
VSGIGRPHRFPELIETERALEKRQRRQEYALGALVIGLLILAMAIGGCNGSHGRC